MIKEKQAALCRGPADKTVSNSNHLSIGKEKSKVKDELRKQIYLAQHIN